jgi:hypothetical protein
MRANAFHRPLLGLLFLLLLALTPLSAAPVAAEGCAFEQGFLALYNLIPEVVGPCASPVEYDLETGNAVQQTAYGRLLWRRASNLTAFTDGSRTWINGPYGLQTRLAGERFRWETAPRGMADPALKYDVWDAFRRALRDAERAEPWEISRRLIAVREDNDRLVWRGEPGRRQVLGVTWTDWPGYKAQVGQATNASRDIWVTMAPEVKRFCQGRAFPDADMRLEQLLGLRPESGKKYFVEIWASPKDIFRPSPDPEITDHEAELDFPDSRLLIIKRKHIDWINDLKAISYQETGFPWTRLGYTYDWGNPRRVVGPSEFVIEKGAPIEVHAVTLTHEYCQ